MNFNILKQNFLEVFSNYKFIILGIFTFIIIGFPFYYFTNISLIQGNFGTAYILFQILLQILISSLFAIFLPISIFKYIKFSKYSIKENTSSFFGTFFGILVAGCPACSITLASYLGLTSLISYLPFYGIELKLIAIFLLIYSNYSILKTLNICEIK